MSTSHKFVSLFHILFVGILFLYVSINQVKTPAFIFPLLKYLGIFIIIYHCYKSYLKIMDNKSAWVNYIHIFFIGPLLVTIGLNGINTTKKIF